MLFLASCVEMLPIELPPSLCWYEHDDKTSTPQSVAKRSRLLVCARAALRRRVFQINAWGSRFDSRVH